VSNFPSRHSVFAARCYASARGVYPPPQDLGARTWWYRRQTQVLDWASRNNLRLNRTKSKELISSFEKKSVQPQPPPPCPNIERVGCAKVLGITLNDRLSATDHVNNLLTSCSSLLYVMRVVTASRLSRSTTCFAPPSSLRSRTVSLHGLVSAQHAIRPCKTRLISIPLQAPWFL